jgi:CcmD family protein
MTSMKRVVGALLLAASCIALGSSAAAQQQPPERQEVYVPIEELPPQDQLPAAPLLIGAYAFVIVVLFLYLVSLSRRLSVVRREVERLETDLKRTSRP